MSSIEDSCQSYTEVTHANEQPLEQNKETVSPTDRMIIVPGINSMTCVSTSRAFVSITLQVLRSSGSPVRHLKRVLS